MVSMMSLHTLCHGYASDAQILLIVDYLYSLRYRVKCLPTNTDKGFLTLKWTTM